MEYVFGTNGATETLRTKGGEHSDLTGFQEVTREYPNEKITDRFYITRKLDSAEDLAGSCYDWYEIEKHYRNIDRSAPIAAAEERNTANIDFLSMMSGIDLPEVEE